jgi:NADH-quinone oxidoreductase subunit A
MMLFDFANVLVFALVSVAFIYGTLLIARLVRPKKYLRDKAAIYECGEPTIGSSWVRFNIRFYTIALVFLIFDVEVVFLFPVVVVLKQQGLLAFSEILVFVVVLAVGLVYAWRFGNLDWIRGGEAPESLEDASKGEKKEHGLPQAKQKGTST